MIDLPRELPRELPPDPALKARVMSALVAKGLLRRRRPWTGWTAWGVAAAAVVVLGIGVLVLRPRHVPLEANTYVLFLYEDSTYRPAPAGHGMERVAELSRWADSLRSFGEFERAGHLVGPGPIGGMFMVRAATDADAARIVASCPFNKWGGHIELKRFEP